MKALTAFFLTLLLTLGNALSAQGGEAPAGRKASFEMGLGINFAGPAGRLAKIMDEYDLDETVHYSSSGFYFSSSGSVEYPRSSPAGISLQGTYARPLGTKAGLGFRVHYGRLGRARGYRKSKGRLDVSTANMSLMPLYSRDLGSGFEMTFGPAFMLNFLSVSEFGAGYFRTEALSKFSAGLHGGLSLKLWDKATFGKLSLQGILSTKNTVGPFTPGEIGEERLGFGHWNLVLSVGMP